MTVHLPVLQPAPPDEPWHGARGARKHPVRATTISVKRMTKRERELGRLLYPPVDEPRPRTRADCIRGERPCPWVACRFHLYLDVSPRTGSIKLNFPDLEPDEMAHSCVLDIADEGGASLERVGEIMNLTRERIRQIEVPALEKVLLSAPFLGDFTDEGSGERKGARV